MLLWISVDVCIHQPRLHPLSTKFFSIPISRLTINWETKTVVGSTTANDRSTPLLSNTITTILVFRYGFLFIWSHYFILRWDEENGQCWSISLITETRTFALLHTKYEYKTQIWIQNPCVCVCVCSNEVRDTWIFDIEGRVSDATFVLVSTSLCRLFIFQWFWNWRGYVYCMSVKRVRFVGLCSFTAFNRYVCTCLWCITKYASIRWKNNVQTHKRIAASIKNAAGRKELNHAKERRKKSRLSGNQSRTITLQIG